MMVYDSTCLDKEDTIRLNEISDENKEKFFSVLDEFYVQYGIDPFWWFLPLTSRNENYDDSFYKICLLLLIIEKISSGKCKRVITNREDIKESLEIYCKSRGINVPVVLVREPRESFFVTRAFSSLLVLLGRIYNELKMVFIERALNSCNIEDGRILVWGPLLINKIRGKVYEDGYFPGLNNFCGEKFYYFPYLIYNTDDKWRRITERINNIDTYGFVHMRAYHRWYDSFFCFRYRLFCNGLKKKKFIFGEYDITPIVCSSIDKELHRTDYYYVATYYAATKRLARESPIRKIILWYEARPVDIAISLAIRDSGKDIQRVGYIGYPLAECMLGQPPTKGQVDSSVVPEIISVPGKAYECVIKEFAPKQKTIIAPAFRVKTTREEKYNHSGYYVLFVILSYYSSVNRDMIRIVNDYIQNSNNEDFHVLVKMHPTCAGKKIAEFYDDKLFFDPEYTDKNIYDCLKGADIAFTAASASSMDVILSGTYLICLCNKGQLYYTSIAPGIGYDRYSIIFDESDFEKAMIDALEFNNSENRTKLNADDYFVSVNKRNFESLFS